MSKNMAIGFVLFVVAVALAYYWPNIFFWPMVSLIEGAIVPFLVFLGLIFFLIGWDELTAPKFEEKPAAKPKKKR